MTTLQHTTLTSNFKTGLRLNDVLSAQEIKRLDKLATVKKNTVIAVGTSSILISTLAANQQAKNQMEAIVHTPNNQTEVAIVPLAEMPAVDSTVKEKTTVVEAPAQKVAADVAYSAEKEYGKPFDNVGTLTKSELQKIDKTMIRPVKAADVKTIRTAGITKVDGKEAFDPYVRYDLAKSLSVYAPNEGVVVSSKEADLVIEHETEGMKFYTHLKGVDPQLKEGAIVHKGDQVGTASKHLSFAVSKTFTSDSAKDFIHPAQFVDTDASNAYRYGSAAYYSNPEVAVAQSLKGTKVEEVVKGLPESVKTSNILKGVVIENEQQTAILKSQEYFYDNGVLPIELIENGKANVSPQVRELEPLIREEAKKYQIEPMTEFLLALLQQESGGAKNILQTDPFQSSQSKNEVIGSIQNQRESIQQGVKHFVDMLKMNDMFEASHHGDIRQAIHSYNFGGRVSRIAKEKDLGYSVKYMQEMSSELSDEYGKVKNADWRGEYAYGDFTYVAKIFNSFTPDANWKNRVAEKKEALIASRTKAAEEQAAKDKLVAQQVSSIPTSTASVDGLTVNNLQESEVLKGKVIVLDAGHGGHDPGARGIDGKTTEAMLNLAITQKAKEVLEKQGATILMARPDTNSYTKPAVRGLFANEQNADLVVSFHNNSAAKTSVSGFETLFKGSDPSSQKLASDIHHYMGQALGMNPDRGLKKRDDLAIFNAGQKTSVLLETGFVTNENDLELLKNETIQKSIANAVTKGIIDNLGLTYEEAPQQSEKEEVGTVEENTESENESILEEENVTEPIEEEKAEETNDNKDSAETEKDQEETNDNTVEDVSENESEQPSEELEEVNNEQMDSPDGELKEESIEEENKEVKEEVKENKSFFLFDILNFGNDKEEIDK